MFKFTKIHPYFVLVLLFFYIELTLTYYLDEFAFRFNRKLSTHRGKLFYRLMQQAVSTPPQPYDVITMQLDRKG